MSTKGLDLGGIHTLEDLRGRCVIDTENDCWHFRLPGGKALTRGLGHRIFVGGRLRTITRAVWYLADKPEPRFRRIVYRACESYDCANPAHLACGTRSTMGRHLRAIGAYSPEGQAHVRAVLAATRATKLTPELRQWIAESSQDGPSLAHALDIDRKHAWRVRQQQRARPNSIWQLGAFA